MEISTRFKNPTCLKIWTDEHYLYWKKDRREKKELKSEFLIALANINPDKDSLINFMQQYGSLWSGDKIILESALAMIRFYQLLWLLKKGVKDMGQPKQAEELMEKFFTPLERWEQNWRLKDYFIIPGGCLGYLNPPLNHEEVKKRLALINTAIATAVNNEKIGLPPEKKRFKLLLIVAKSGQTQILPTELSPESWPLFDLLPALTTWEKRKEWLHKQLLNNVKPLLRNNINLSPIVRNGSIRMAARPANAFTWAVGRLVLEKERLCRCGAPTSSGKYCTRKCELDAMSTGVKQSFLDYFNKQVKRGKVTSEEGEFTKEYVRRTFKPKDSKDKLLLKVLKSLDIKYPDRDFSFLRGFGSRKSKVL